MSLLADAMESCTMYDKSIVEDGYGGYTTAYTEGVSFQAAIVVDNSINAQVALSQAAVGIYTITTTKAINLQFRDVFKRDSDGKIFRVTSDGDDKKTPNTARLNMRQVTAQEWSLSGEVIETEEVEGGQNNG